MSPSEQLDRLSTTFSTDRAFCDQMLSSDSGPKVAEILAWYHWGRTFFPHIQKGLLAMVPSHFAPGHQKIAEFWTSVLTHGIISEVGLIPYLVVRGLIPEAGSVVRRGLEHTGLLTRLWYESSKAALLEDAPDGREFIQAFQSESNKKLQSELKARRVKKRFAHCTFGQPASVLYEIFSNYNVHGGIGATLLRSSLDPTTTSCGFVITGCEIPEIGLTVIGEDLLYDLNKTTEEAHREHVDL
jgi:hypothetical protein